MCVDAIAFLQNLLGLGGKPFGPLALRARNIGGYRNLFCRKAMPPFGSHQAPLPCTEDRGRSCLNGGKSRGRSITQQVTSPWSFLPRRAASTSFRSFGF
jgi:hypothetical protein